MEVGGDLYGKERGQGTQILDDYDLFESLSTGKKGTTATINKLKVNGLLTALDIVNLKKQGLSEKGIIRWCVETYMGTEAEDIFLMVTGYTSKKITEILTVY